MDPDDLNLLWTQTCSNHAISFVYCAEKSEVFSDKQSNKRVSANSASVSKKSKKANIAATSVASTKNDASIIICEYCGGKYHRASGCFSNPDCNEETKKNS
jgi:hypothetical protein